MSDPISEGKRERGNSHRFFRVDVGGNPLLRLDNCRSSRIALRSDLESLAGRGEKKKRE